MHSRVALHRCTGITDLSTIRVEIVYAATDRQLLIELDADDGFNVEQVLQSSGIYAQFADEPLCDYDVGIWGRCVPRDYTVRDGDRVEIYRPLLMDPRDARRLRAKSAH